MIRFGWRGGLSCLVVGLLVGDVVAQNPTLSLIPAAAPFTRQCSGGPEHGDLCSNTADCERTAQGAIYTECQHVCRFGDDDGVPCTDRFDCQSGICWQRCSCNRWMQGSPGLFVVADIKGSNWSPTGQLIESFQATIDLSSACTAVRPFGWDRPCSGDFHCVENADCIDHDLRYPICGVSGFCEGNQHSPDKFSFICEPGNASCQSRPDYVFYQRGELQAMDVSTLAFRYASLLLQPPGPLYTTPKYFGTLSLQIQPLPDGCGTVTIGLNSPGDSGMADRDRFDITPLDLEGLTIVLPNCPCDEILSSTPTSCTADGRQGTEPNGSSPAGWTSVALKLNCPDATGMRASAFSIEVQGGGTSTPDTISINDPDNGWVTLHFPPTPALSAPPGAWTCFQLNDTQACLGGLPGDSDGNNIVEAVDVLRVVECIGSEECELHECDMDHSGTCSAPDLLRVVDLLGGTESYEPGWLGESLPVCPDALGGQ